MTKNLAINVTLFSHHPHLDIIQMRGSFFLIWLLLLFQLVLYPAVVMVWFLNEEHALSWPQALPTSDHCSSQVTRVFKKSEYVVLRSISQAENLNLLQGISISRLSWAPLFLMRSHCKAFLFIGDVMSISEHKPCAHTIQGRRNRGDQKPWNLPNSSIS